MSVQSFMRPALTGAALVLTMTGQASATVTVQELTSPDGHGYWLVQEAAVPIVSVEMRFDGGIRVDSLDQAGRANMTTWLMNEGSGDLDALAFERRADDISARIGFSLEYDAAFVSARFLTETLDEGVDLLAMAISKPRFDPEPIDRARKSILSDMAAAETNPEVMAWNAWFEQTYPGHIYSARETGKKAVVEALTRDDFVKAHQAMMNQANAHVVIVGDIAPDRAGLLVDQALGGLPKGEVFVDKPSGAVPTPGQTIIELDVPQSVAVFGHAGFTRDDPDYIAAYVMNSVFGSGGFQTRLMTEVREKRGLAYGVYAYMSPYREGPVFFGSVQTGNERVAESLEVIKAEWARMAADGPTEDELEKAKTYLTGSFPLRFDSNAKIANFLLFMKATGLGTDYLTERNALINAVTVEDAKRVAARLLKTDALSVVVVGQPKGLEATE